MRDIRTELDALRQKLQKMHQRPPAAEPAPAAAPRLQSPPWETAGDESAFEESLLSNAVSVDGFPHFSNSDRVSGDIEACISGTVVENAKGRHFQTETRFPFSSSHGNFDLQGLAKLPGSIIEALCPEHQGGYSEKWAFLDTETNGLSGGAGSFAFLVGLGMVREDAFVVRQYFLREPAEEASALESIAQDLQGFETLVTYNGRTFDAPLLETRYRLARAPVPFEAMPHLDLLFACRRLWKRRFESCRLTGLERDVLGYERVGDVPGFLIPTLYTNYLRTKDAGSLTPVFTHNALDILSLACLTSVVGVLFQNPEQALRRHPAECLGLGKWLLQVGRKEEALPFLWKAANGAIPEDLLARTLWDIAIVHRQLGQYAAMQHPLEQLLGFPNHLQNQALEALAILFERRLCHPRKALEYARELERRMPGERTAGRVERLVAKLSRNGSALLME
jgi:uncharacterized protein YprB with RNaseH-like and TPR domain